MDIHQHTARERLSFRISPWPAWLAAAVLMFMAPAGLTEPANDELRREWLQIQVNADRKTQAAWWRDLEFHEMRRLVAAGVLLDVTDRRGWTPLHSAARFNSDSRVLVALLDGGADVNATDKAGDTPLHWAAAENASVEVIRELISAGADVNACDRYGWTPLHTAAESSPNPKVLLELLDAGAERGRRAYFVLFGPRFLLRHNPNLSREQKTQLREALKKPKPTSVALNAH